MFCRSKLMISGIPDDVYEAAVASGSLRARFALTNAKGNPVTARLVPPAVEWSVPTALPALDAPVLDS